MMSLPSGTVTFLFTDIEGSALLAQQFPSEMPALLARHHAFLPQAIQAHNGHVFQIFGGVQAENCAMTMEQAVEYALSWDGET